MNAYTEMLMNKLRQHGRIEVFYEVIFKPSGTENESDKWVFGTGETLESAVEDAHSVAARSGLLKGGAHE